MRGRGSAKNRTGRGALLRSFLCWPGDQVVQLLPGNSNGALSTPVRGVHILLLH